MGKREEVTQLSSHIYSSRDIPTQLHGLIEMLVTISSGTKYQYDVEEAIKAYNAKAEWANLGGVHNHIVFEVFE